MMPAASVVWPKVRDQSGLVRSVVDSTTKAELAADQVRRISFWLRETARFGRGAWKIWQALSSREANFKEPWVVSR